MKHLIAEKGDLRANLQTIRQKAGNAELVVDLSADGQGLGLLQLARLAVQEGVSTVAVSEARDALELRRCGLRCHILLLRSSTDAAELRELVPQDITFTLSSNEAAIALNGVAGEQGLVAEARIRIDTGLGHYGFLPAETEPMLSIFRHMPAIAVTGVYTRLPGLKRSVVEQQYGRFMGAVQALAAQGADTGCLLALDDAQLLLTELGSQGAVLVGDGLLGHPTVGTRAALKPVGLLEAELEELKWLDKGAPVGSGRKLRKPTRVAVVDVGRYHGLLPKGSLLSRLPLPGRAGAFRVNGKKAPILGSAALCELTLDVTRCDCKAGDLAVLAVDPRLVQGIPAELRE